MRKLTKISAVVAILASVGVNANASDWYVGAEVGHSEIDVKAKTTIGSISGESDGGHQAIKLGKYFGENARIGGTFYRFNEEEDVDVSLWTVGADYLIGNEKLKPFVGLSIGSLEYKESGISSSYSKSSVELDSTVYGLGFGLNYKLNDNIELETGYKIIKTDGKDSITHISTNTKIDFESDNAKSWYFGLNYRF